MLQASWGKGADRKPGKGMPKTWAQLGFQVLPRNDITVHRALQNSTLLGRFATLFEVALAIIPSANLRIKKSPTIVNPKIHPKIMPVRRVGIGNANGSATVKLS